MSTEIRPYASLAADLKIGVRQFHRRLRDKDPEACSALRSEIVAAHSEDLRMLIGNLQEGANLLAQCDPDVSSLLTKLGLKIQQIRSTPLSEFRQEHARRMEALSDLSEDELPEDQYAAFSNNTRELPPTVEQWRGRGQITAAELKAVDSP